MKIITRVCVVAAISLLFTVPAFGYSEIGVETHAYNDVFTGDTQNLSAPDRVSYSSYPSCTGGGCAMSGGHGFASAYADSTALKVGVRTSAGSFDARYGGSGSAKAYMSNTFTVRENSALGIEKGDTVNLSMAIRLNGSTIVNNGGQAWWSTAAMGVVAGSSIPRPGTGEFQQQEVLSFTARWATVADSMGYGSTTAWQGNNIMYYDQNNYKYITSAGQCAAGDPTCSYSYTRYDRLGSGDFPTVSNPLDIALTLNFTAEVGKTYTLFENMSSLVDFGGGTVGSAEMDFSHTFTGAVSSENPNIVFDWGVPLASPTTVPEPASILLLGLGLAGLAEIRRRMK